MLLDQGSIASQAFGFLEQGADASDQASHIVLIPKEIQIRITATTDDIPEFGQSPQ